METFNQQRMDRCMKIALAIIENWRATNSAAYTVRSADPIGEGVSLDELRTRYFSVGLGDDLTDVPFTDLLVIFSIVEQHAAAMKKPTATAGGGFKVRYSVTTDWPDEEAVRVLSQIQIHTPDGKGRYLRFAATPDRPLAAEDDPQP